MMYNATSAMERLALIFAFHTDRKELKKVITRFRKFCCNQVRDDIIKPILDAEDYNEHFEYLESLYAQFKALGEKFAEEGHPAMVVVGDEAYPVQITLMNSKQRMLMYEGLTVEKAGEEIKQDRFWALNNEYELQLSSGHSVMNTLNLDILYFKVQLFESKGFSGTIADLGVQRVKGAAIHAPGQSSYIQGDRV
jgi:hypothetical protein